MDSLENMDKKIEDINEYDAKLLEYGVRLINYRIIKYEKIDKKFKFF